MDSKRVKNIKKLPILISLLIGAFFSLLNEILLNVAFSQLTIELNVSGSTIQWLATGYMLVVAILIPASALLVQWFTTRILSTIGFGGIVYGFSSSGERWDNLRVYGMIIMGLVALFLFVIRQLKLKEPLLDLRAFTYPMFSLTTIILIIMMMTMFSTMSLLPFLFQGALGLTVYATGLIMLPGSLLNGLLSPVTGKLFDRFGPRALIIPGTVILAVVMWFFTQVTADTSKMTFITLHVSMMVSISMIMMPAQTNGLNQLPRHFYPHGTAILNTLSQVAGAIGVAFFISIMTSGQRNYLEQSSNPTDPAQMTDAMVSGVHNAFTIGFDFALLAVIVALFIKRSQTPKE